MLLVAGLVVEGGGDTYRLPTPALALFSRLRDQNILPANVHITDSRGVTITGNTFWEGFQHDLLIERSSHA